MRMLLIILLLLVAFLDTAAMTSKIVAQSPPACNPDTLARSDFRDKVLEYATAPATDTVGVYLRNRLSIPAVPASQVTTIATATTCSKARDAYAKLAKVSAATLSVIVVKAGSVYVVMDPRQHTGEWKLAITFDGQWRKLAGFDY